MKQQAELLRRGRARPRAGKFNIALNIIKGVKIGKICTDKPHLANLPVQRSRKFSDRITDERIKKKKGKASAHSVEVGNCDLSKYCRNGNGGAPELALTSKAVDSSNILLLICSEKDKIRRPSTETN